MASSIFLSEDLDLAAWYNPADFMAIPEGSITEGPIPWEFSESTPMGSEVDMDIVQEMALRILVTEPGTRAEGLREKRTSRVPYPCPHTDCDDGFGRRFELVKHLEKIHKQAPKKLEKFYCSYADCTAKYSRQAFLEKHIKAKH